MVRVYGIAETFADLRLNTGPEEALVQVMGNTVVGDSGKGMFIYDCNSVAVDDNFNVIRPTGETVGAWIRHLSYANSPVYYNDGGMITSPIKKWVKVVTPSTGNGYSIDISAAGFSSILSTNIIVVKNNATANLNPLVSIKSISTSAIVVNITEGNSAVVSILGINVLSGSPCVFASVTGLTLYVEVTGY